MEGTLAWTDDEDKSPAEVVGESPDFAGWDVGNGHVADDGLNGLRLAFGIPALFIVGNGDSFREVTADLENSLITWRDLDETTTPKVSEVAEAWANAEAGLTV